MGPLATTRATTPDGLVTTVNAWTPNTPAYDPGGSSSGSATATAARLACSSIGTQTGGSITSPANQQGLTGLKPTMGRTSLYGIIPLTYSRDHAGPIARDALDAAIMTQVMAGPDPKDPRTQGLPRVPDLVEAVTHDWHRHRRRTTLGVPAGLRLRHLGDGPRPRRDAPAVLARSACGSWRSRSRRSGTCSPAAPSTTSGCPSAPSRSSSTSSTDLKLFGVSLNSWMQGLFLSGDEWIKGQRAKHVLARRVLDDLFSQCDLVLQTNPVPFDIIGLPEIAFPIGFQPNAASGRDVPIGAIIGGRPYQEDRLLSLVGAYQAETDWHLRRPADPPPVAARAASGRASRPRRWRCSRRGRRTSTPALTGRLARRSIIARGWVRCSRGESITPCRRS